MILSLSSDAILYKVGGQNSPDTTELVSKTQNHHGMHCIIENMAGD